MGKWTQRARLGCLLCLITLGVALFLSPALRGRLSGAVMLFTQKSVHTLAGALRSTGGLAAPDSVLLAVFHAAALPWLPRLLPLANSMVFGPVLGFFLSLSGTLVGGSVCFFLSRLLLRPLIKRLESPPAHRLAAHWGGAWCCAALLLFPGATGFAGYLSGMSSLGFRRYFVGAAVGESATLLVYQLYCSPYSTLLPDAARFGLGLAGAAILAACLAVTLRNSDETR